MEKLIMTYHRWSIKPPVPNKPPPQKIIFHISNARPPLKVHVIQVHVMFVNYEILGDSLCQNNQRYNNKSNFENRPQKVILTNKPGGLSDHLRYYILKFLIIHIGPPPVAGNGPMNSVPYILPYITHFSQNWFISFFWYFASS